jgi:hypothetical protein
MRQYSAMHHDGSPVEYDLALSCPSKRCLAIAAPLLPQCEGRACNQVAKASGAESQPAECLDRSRTERINRLFRYPTCRKRQGRCCV